MQGCVVSFKECWQDEAGSWMSYGGFPLQMSAISSLFDQFTLLVVRGRERAGGIALPPNARVITLDRPVGEDLRRKVSVVLNMPGYIREIARHIRRCDAVYIPLPGDIPLIGMLVTVVLRRRMLARYGGSWLPTKQTTFMNRVTRTFMRVLAGGRNVMLATGAGSEPPARGIRWIFVTAISEREIESTVQSLDRAASRPLRLVYAGRLSAEKGVRVLTEAIRLMREQDLTSTDKLPHLTFVGDGPQRQEIEESIRRNNCGDLVSFTGQLGRRELLDQFANADVCVLPSLTESFCKARLDAMLCGVPVLTTEVGFGRELVGSDGERGWVVPAGNAQALAESIMKLSENQIDWPALRKRCRQFVSSMSLETWTHEIGSVCADRWGLKFEGGKLR